MKREELVQKLLQIYGSGELEQINRIVSEIHEQVIDGVHEIIKGHDGLAPGEYDEKTKTIILYEDNFNPKVLFHEIGHCIYHEYPEIAELTNSEYEKDIKVKELLTTKGAAEFCANSYQLHKTGTVSTEEDPERFRSLAEKMGEKRI